MVATMDQKPQTSWARYADEDLKRQFAKLCRERPDNQAGRFEAASLVFPKDVDTFLVLKAADEWPFDPIVIAEHAELGKAEAADELPSREQQARDVYRLAQDKEKTVDDRLKAHKLYADLMGYVQKPGASAGVNIYNDNRRVMLMPNPANSLDEWENAASQHQSKLIIDAASTLANR